MSCWEDFNWERFASNGYRLILLMQIVAMITCFSTRSYSMVSMLSWIVEFIVVGFFRHTNPRGIINSSFLVRWIWFVDIWLIQGALSIIGIMLLEKFKHESSPSSIIAKIVIVKYLIFLLSYLGSWANFWIKWFYIRVPINKFCKRNLVENNQEECPICLCEMLEGPVVQLPNCGHRFHQDCISTWLVNQKKCPLCRAPVILDFTTSENTPLIWTENSPNTFRNI